jgi:hypothetical protein
LLADADKLNLMEIRSVEAVVKALNQAPVQYLIVGGRNPQSGTALRMPRQAAREHA